MNTDHTALDPAIVEEFSLGQSEQDEAVTPTEEVIEETGTEPENESIATSEEAESSPEVVETVEGEEDKNSEPPTTKLTIDGIGEVELDEIKEWQKGYLRQSDYTKKTQELAKQREDYGQAVEVFEYLRQNPHLVDKLKEYDSIDPRSESILRKSTPESDMVRQIWYNQKSMEIDQKVAAIEAKYGTEVDTVALFNKAAELKTDDLETVYRSLAFDDMKPVDKKALIEEAKAELKAELAAQKKATASIVSNQPATAVTTTPKQLSAAEKRVAANMNMTEAEYAKWR